MEDFEIIGWPEIQYFMELEGFDANATLIEPHGALGIDSSTYLVSKEWLESLGEKPKKEPKEILEWDEDNQKIILQF